MSKSSNPKSFSLSDESSLTEELTEDGDSFERESESWCATFDEAISKIVENQREQIQSPARNFHREKNCYALTGFPVTQTHSIRIGWCHFDATLFTLRRGNSNISDSVSIFVSIDDSLFISKFRAGTTVDNFTQKELSGFSARKKKK